jgi:membrane protein YdbS with pleckstrin-like domain
MASDPPIADPAQRDLAWNGYHPRALAPAIGLAGILSVLLWTGRWYLEDLSELSDRLGSLVVFSLAWGVWLLLAAVFLYRTVTFTYRLTDRALLVDFGFIAPPVPPIPLADVTTVAVGGGWIFRCVGVGWIEVRTTDRAVRLRGVRQPHLFAVAIRDAAGKLKEGSQ